MKKLVSLGLVSFTVLALGAPMVHAADGDTAAKATSEGTVKIIDDDEEVDPEKPEVVDPTDPTSPPTTVNPGEEPEEGSGGNGKKTFNINWISNFHFGEVKIGSNMSAFAQATTLDFGKWVPAEDPEDDDVWEQTAKKENLAPFLQVTDNRGGNSNGWHVQVTGTEFKNVTSDEVLQGAEIYLNDGVVLGNPESISYDKKPTNVGTADTNILTGTAMNVFNAKKGSGLTTWTLAWGANGLKDGDVDEANLAQAPLLQAGKGVKFSVPSGSNFEIDASYKAEMTWTLIDGPMVDK